MAFRIGTNLPSLAAQNSLNRVQRDLESSLVRLSSGKRINRASDDAAGMAIGERLSGQQKGLEQAIKNTSNVESFIYAAEGTLNEQNNILIRLRELAIQGASDTVSDVERGFLDHEFQALNAELDRISQLETFRGHHLLNGQQNEFTFQVGPNAGPENQVTMSIDIDSTAYGLGVDGLGVSDQDDALDSIESIDEALTKVGGYRSQLGAFQSRFEATQNVLETERIAIADAKSKMLDTNYAEETSNLVKNQILNEAATAVLAQANSFNGRAVRLLERI